MPCTCPSWISYSLPVFFSRPFCKSPKVILNSQPFLQCAVVLSSFLPSFLPFAWPERIFLHSIDLCVCWYPHTCKKKENGKNVPLVYLMLVYVLEMAWDDRSHLSDDVALHHFFHSMKWIVQEETSTLIIDKCWYS